MWNDRVFGAIPLAPAWIAAGLALALLCLYLATVIATGDLAEFAEGKGRWWHSSSIAILLSISRDNTGTRRTSGYMGSLAHFAGTAAFSCTRSRRIRAASLEWLAAFPKSTC
jgi:hypothetical protein